MRRRGEMEGVGVVKKEEEVEEEVEEGGRRREGNDISGLTSQVSKVGRERRADKIVVCEV